MAHYHDETARQPMFDTGYGGSGTGPQNGLPMSPGGGRPYSPGLRSQNQRQPSSGDDFETQSPAGVIPLQSFQDGMPPAPSVQSTWHKIDTWAEENYPELFDQLCEGCTSNDLNELEHMLDCSLPQDVRDSLQMHDGQERGGNPTGIIFGSMLLDCEEVVQEWQNWRKVNQEFLNEVAVSRPPPPPPKAQGGSSSEASSSRTPASPSPSSRTSNWRQDLLAKQDCVPPASIRRAYAHPAWIPLVRDWGGNNLAVDLAPGPRGVWGQIILFGRDYDTKYVVARSWASFLAIVADDLASGRWFVEEDSGELKLREFKNSRVEPAYFNILRWRMDQKYGRTANKRRSMAPGAVSPTGSQSPYASPTDGGEVRGRSLQRLSNISPIPSPIRPGYGKPSPLARVTEEGGVATLGLKIPNNLQPREKLVEVDTPRPSGELDKENMAAPRLAALTNGVTPTSEQTILESPPRSHAEGKKPMVIEEPMKTIEI